MAAARLLDTQLLLWLAITPERLSGWLITQLENRKTIALFSVASLW